MMYPFLKLNDGTMIVYSNIQEEANKGFMLIRAERWNDAHDDFDTLEFTLPNCEIQLSQGFTPPEKKFLVQRVKKFEKLLFQWAKEDQESNSYKQL